MKITYSFFILLLTGLSACKKEAMSPVTDLMETADTSAVAVRTGMFTSGPYGTVGGNVAIYKTASGNFQLQLKNFSSNNGPDLYVYLSSEIMPVNFISLGVLRSVNGDQLYDIPGMPSFTQYKYVNIHCQRFNHLFGYALLQ